MASRYKLKYLEQIYVLQNWVLVHSFFSHIDHGKLQVTLVVVDNLAPPEGAENFHIVSSKIGMGTAGCRLRLKCDDTGAETIFRFSTKRTSQFKSAGASVHSTTGSRGVRISGSNAGYTMFRGSVRSTGYPFHSPVSPSLPLPCFSVCHHISTGLYQTTDGQQQGILLEDHQRAVTCSLPLFTL